MIYFITAGTALSPVKIGYTDNVTERLRRLQHGNPEQLYVIATIPGDIAREHRLHARFAPGRLVGEWFDPTAPGLDDFLSAAIHFEGFYPEDTQSEYIRMVLNA